MHAKLITAIKDFGRLAQRVGPYVVLEVVLPGGTLFALLLYLYRSGQLRSLADVRGAAGTVLGAANQAFDQLAFTLQPLGAVPIARDGLEPLGFLPAGR
ncbi:MAG: hypothetical protein IT518_15090 [Burkholderiales bacterium]|nr:hypothetical protein [Burkholderiales bacterium]